MLIMKQRRAFLSGLVILEWRVKSGVAYQFETETKKNNKKNLEWTLRRAHALSLKQLSPLAKS